MPSDKPPEPAPTLEEAVVLLRAAVPRLRELADMVDYTADIARIVIASDKLIRSYEASRSPSTTVGEGSRKTASEVVGWISSVGHQDLSDAAPAPVDGKGGDRG